MRSSLCARAQDDREKLRIERSFIQGNALLLVFRSPPMSAAGQTRPIGPFLAMSGLPPLATKLRTSQIGSFVPCVDGSELARTFFSKQHWSVQPCVRPVGAVHM